MWLPVDPIVLPAGSRLGALAGTFAYLSVGFAFVTGGMFLAGVVYNFTDFSLEQGILFESFLVVIGFALIAYSLFTR